MKPLIVISGNIGSGKSTIAERLGDELGLPVSAEPSENNPYLEDFYQDMAGYAYQSQLFFMSRGLLQHRRVDRSGGAIIDRSFFEHHLVFACQLYADGYISDQDFSVLSDLYYGVQDLLAPPDLLVMLEASPGELMRRISERNKADRAIDRDYLERLDARYREFADGWTASPLLRIDTEELDPRTEEGLDELVSELMDWLEY